MMKSLRCRPPILWVHQLTVTLPHSVSSDGEVAQVAPSLARHFGAVRPALTGIGVASLASRDTLIEVEALAKLRRHPG